MQTPQYPDVPPDFGHWLAGFIDGEATFIIERTRHTKRGYHCGLAIGLRDDDRAILEMIADVTGLGCVVARSAQRPTSKPLARWHVHARADCLRLVAILDAYPLRAKKARDYAIWREAILLWMTIRNGVNAATADAVNGPAWARIGHLERQLCEGRAYHAPTPTPASSRT